MVAAPIICNGSEIQDLRGKTREASKWKFQELH